MENLFAKLNILSQRIAMIDDTHPLRTASVTMFL